MNATVSWNANTESDLAGYVVYHGISSTVYTPADTTTVLVPTTSFTYTGLDVGIIHYFNVKAFDTTGNLSDYGGEVTKFEPIPVYVRDTGRRRVVLSSQMRETDTAHMVSGFIADVMGENLPEPEPPPPPAERVAIGGFMMV